MVKYGYSHIYVPLDKLCNEKLDPDLVEDSFIKKLENFTDADLMISSMKKLEKGIQEIDSGFVFEPKKCKKFGKALQKWYHTRLADYNVAADTSVKDVNKTIDYMGIPLLEPIKV